MSSIPLAMAGKVNEHIQDLATRSRQMSQMQMGQEESRRAWPWLRRTLYAIVNTHRFEVACGAIILINLALVVVETDYTTEESDPPLWVQVLTNCLLGIYTTELAAKMYVYRCGFFRDGWNLLDFIIVGVDLIFIVISLAVDQLPSMSILRVFRLVRLARAFKAAKSFEELHRLLRACTCAFKAIFWGMVLICMTFTIWGILAVQLIHPINQVIVAKRPWIYENCERCPRAFSTVFDSVLTLWKQLVAGDSWGELCEPIVEEERWTFLFFMLVLVSINLLMLNCILAVVVEAGAAASAADLHDKAVQQHKVVAQAEEKLIEICEALDKDDSGSVSKDEFLNGFRDSKDFRECLEVMHVTESDMDMIFNICDEDDSGDVDYREFVDQLRRIKHSGEQMLLDYVTNIRKEVRKLGKAKDASLFGFGNSVTSLQKKLLSDEPQNEEPLEAAAKALESIRNLEATIAASANDMQEESTSCSVIDLDGLMTALTAPDMQRQTVPKTLQPVADHCRERPEFATGRGRLDFHYCRGDGDNLQGTLDHTDSSSRRGTTANAEPREGTASSWRSGQGSSAAFDFEVAQGVIPSNGAAGLISTTAQC